MYVLLFPRMIFKMIYFTKHFQNKLWTCHGGAEWFLITWFTEEPFLRRVNFFRMFSLLDCLSSSLFNHCYDIRKKSFGLEPCYGEKYIENRSTSIKAFSHDLKYHDNSSWKFQNCSKKSKKKGTWRKSSVTQVIEPSSGETISTEERSGGSW